MVETKEERIRKIVAARMKEANNLLDQALLKMQAAKECLNFLEILQGQQEQEDKKDGK